jgi:hypothetical protein
MHYIDLYAYLKKPEKTWLGFIDAKKMAVRPTGIIPVSGAYFLLIENPTAHPQRVIIPVSSLLEF